MGVRRWDFVEGEVLYINKPLRWTSFDVVNAFRRRLVSRLGMSGLKVGHAGTLDPLATGVMIVCTGKATRRVAEFQGQMKEYIAEVKLGATTPSFDLEQSVDAEYPTAHITRGGVEEVLGRFRGEIAQVPPAYSAVRVNGRRAYKYARKGKAVLLRARKQVVETLELLEYALPVVKLRVVCSGGTYIRALARDIGEALGSGGHLIALERTRIGEVTLADCMSVEEMDGFLNREIRR